MNSFREVSGIKDEKRGYSDKKQSLNKARIEKVNNSFLHFV